MFAIRSSGSVMKAQTAALKSSSLREALLPGALRKLEEQLSEL